MGPARTAVHATSGLRNGCIHPNDPGPGHKTGGPHRQGDGPAAIPDDQKAGGLLWEQDAFQGSRSPARPSWRRWSRRRGPASRGARGTDRPWPRSSTARTGAAGASTSAGTSGTKRVPGQYSGSARLYRAPNQSSMLICDAVDGTPLAFCSGRKMLVYDPVGPTVYYSEAAGFSPSS